MRGDPVPDIGLGTNYGKTIHLDYETNFGIAMSHTMGNIDPHFSDVTNALGSRGIDMNERVYVDDNSDGVIVTNKLTNLDLLVTVGTATIVASALPIVGTVAAYAGVALTEAAALIAAEDTKEYQATEYDILSAFDKPGGVLILRPFQGISDGHYELTQSRVRTVVLGNDTISFSEDISVGASSADHSVFLIGNGGKNSLTGSGLGDVLIGGGDLDLLYGGNGDDQLYGGTYASIKSKLVGDVVTGNTAEQNAAIGKYADSLAVDDVSILMGGMGRDTMWGSNDNDYFFIDVTTVGSNAGNVDQINEFYVSGINPLVDDWLVFSADQLGISASSLDGWGWSREVVPLENRWLGPGVTKADITGYVLPFGSTEHFFKFNGIENYHAELFPDSLHAFLLDSKNGDLYFDADGDRDVGDQFLVAEFGHTVGDALADMHANQLMILMDFNLLA